MVTQGLCVRGSWRPNRNCNILTRTLMAINVVSFSFSRAAQQEAQRPTLLGDGFLYCILSASSLDPNSSGPQGPFGLMWLSLPHLIYNSDSNSNWNFSGAPRPLRPDVALLTTSRLSLSPALLQLS